jgi:molybdate transport system regulatory protein
LAEPGWWPSTSIEVDLINARTDPPAENSGNAGDLLNIRLDLANGPRIVPAKVAVLEEIARCGSISAAARPLRMSYRRNWVLLDELNAGLGSPVVDTAAASARAPCRRPPVKPSSND